MLFSTSQIEFKMRFGFFFSLFLGACSLSTFETTPCESTDDCRNTFGWTTFCGEDDFCHDIEIPNSCRTGIIPEDFFTNPDEYRHSIPIGVLYNTIDSSVELSAVQAAFWEKPKLDGRPFVLLSCGIRQGIDGISENEESLDFLTETIGVSAIISTFGSETSLFSFEYLQEQGSDTVLFAPFATSPEMDEIEQHEEGEPNEIEPGQLWRLVPDTDIFADAMLEYFSSEIERDFTEENPARVAIVYETSQIGIALFEKVSNSLNENESINLLYNSFDAQTPELERGEEINSSIENIAANEEIDWLFLFSADNGDYSNLVSMSFYRHFDFFSQTRFLFPPYAKNSLFSRELFRSETDPTHEYQLGTTENGTPRVVGIAPNIDTEHSLFSSFNALFSIMEVNQGTDQSAEQSAFATHAYDAAWMTMYATAWAYYNRGQDLSSVTGIDVARGLRQLQSGESYQVGLSDWPEAINIFANGGTIDLKGVSGSLNFDLSTEEIEISEDGYPIELWGLVPNGTELCPESRDGYHCIVSIEEL